MKRVRCPACHTIFRIKTNQMHMRNGMVRCGKCKVPFDALRNIIEESTSSPLQAATLPDLFQPPPPEDAAAGPFSAAEAITRTGSSTEQISFPPLADGISHYSEWQTSVTPSTAEEDNNPTPDYSGTQTANLSEQTDSRPEEQSTADQNMDVTRPQTPSAAPSAEIDPIEVELARLRARLRASAKEKSRNRSSEDIRQKSSSEVKTTPPPRRPWPSSIQKQAKHKDDATEAVSDAAPPSTETGLTQQTTVTVKTKKRREKRSSGSDKTHSSPQQLTLQTDTPDTTVFPAATQTVVPAETAPTEDIAQSIDDAMTALSVPAETSDRTITISVSDTGNIPVPDAESIPNYIAKPETPKNHADSARDTSTNGLEHAVDENTPSQKPENSTSESAPVLALPAPQTQTTSDSISPANAEEQREKKRAERMRAASNFFRTEKTATENPFYTETRTRKGFFRKTYTNQIIVMLCVLLLAQCLFLFRNEITRFWPALRPAYVNTCDMLGCALPLPRSLDDIKIETSDLETYARHPSYFVLNAIVSNTAEFPVDYPYLELTLTDLFDRPLIRRVLPPLAWYPQANLRDGIPPGRRLDIRVPFSVQDDIAPSGYRVSIFYP